MCLGGAAASLAGCADTGDSEAGATERQRARRISDSETYSFRVSSLSRTATAFEFDARPTFLGGETSLSGSECTFRVYTSPNLELESRTKTGETVVTLGDRDPDRPMRVELPLSLESGYAQEVHYTLEITGDVRLPETGIGSRIAIPFYNAARDTEMLRVVESPYPDSGDAIEILSEFWYDERAESPFDVSPVPESEYDPDVYPYRDLTVTALVQFASYDHAWQGPHDIRYEWLVLNVHLSEWELLEAARWNSHALAELEVHPDKRDRMENPPTSLRNQGSLGALGTSGRTDIADVRTPYEQWRHNRAPGSIRRPTHAFKIGTGRPFAKRMARRIETALDNPSFDRVYQQLRPYYALTALKAFTGCMPYTFEVGSYIRTPEETINDWVEAGLSSDGTGAGDCQTATTLYVSVASHLLDKPFASVTMEEPAHAIAGVYDLTTPASLAEVDPAASYATERGAYDTRFGDLQVIEPLSTAASIGWKYDTPRIEISGYVSEPVLNSHVPTNDRFEPDGEGTISSPDENIQNALTYHEDHQTIRDLSLEFER